MLGPSDGPSSRALQIPTEKAAGDAGCESPHQGAPSWYRLAILFGSPGQSGMACASQASRSVRQANAGAVRKPSYCGKWASAVSAPATLIAVQVLELGMV